MGTQGGAYPGQGESDCQPTEDLPRATVSGDEVQLRCFTTANRMDSRAVSAALIRIGALTRHAASIHWIILAAPFAPVRVTPAQWTGSLLVLRGIFHRGVVGHG